MKPISERKWSPQLPGEFKYDELCVISGAVKYSYLGTS